MKKQKTKRNGTSCGEKRGGRFLVGFFRGASFFNREKIVYTVYVHIHFIYFLLWESFVNPEVIMIWDRGLFLVSHVRSKIHSITPLETPDLDR